MVPRSYKPPLVTREDRERILRGITLFELSDAGKYLNAVQLGIYLDFVQVLPKLDMVRRMYVENELKRIKKTAV
jgi:ribosomal protein L13E